MPARRPWRRALPSDCAVRLPSAWTLPPVVPAISPTTQGHGVYADPATIPCVVQPPPANWESPAVASTEALGRTVRSVGAMVKAPLVAVSPE